MADSLSLKGVLVAVCPSYSSRESRPSGRAGMRLTTVQPPSVVGGDPDRKSLLCMTVCGRMTHAVRVSRDTLEPVSSGSPPDDALGESRPVKPDGDDTLGDGSARDSATGHPRSEGGTLPFEAVGEGPETEPACRVPTVWEAPSFTAGEDVTRLLRSSPRPTSQPVPIVGSRTWSDVCGRHSQGSPSVPSYSNWRTRDTRPSVESS